MTKPMRIYPGEFSGRWYATKAYKPRGNGIEVTGTKKDVTDQITPIIKWVERGTAKGIADFFEQNWAYDATLTLDEVVMTIRQWEEDDEQEGKA